MKTKSLLEDASQLPFLTHGRTRVLSIGQAGTIQSRGFKIRFKGSDEKDGQLIDVSNAVWEKLCGYWIVERASRGGLHSSSSVVAGKLLIAARKRVLTVDIVPRKVISTVHIERGSRPLGVCLTPDGIGYFGEYFGNGERSSVRVFGSRNLVNWEVVYEFSPGEIRHIHNIVFDRYRKGVWVLTGDEDHESGLWFSDDRFKNLTLIAGGSQNARAVSVIPQEGGLIVPMDSPDVENHIQYLSLKTLVFKNLISLPGSSFAAAKDGQILLVTTGVESSKVNTDQRVSVFGSIDGKRWRCIMRLRRDMFFMRNVRPYFQYPNIYLPTSDGTNPRVFAFCIGVRGLDGQMISWGRRELSAFLEH